MAILYNADIDYKMKSKEVFIMEMNTVLQAISTVGFPIVSCVALGWFCKWMIETNNKNTGRMFDLFAQSNKEIREAVQNNTEVLKSLKDRLEDLK